MCELKIHKTYPEDHRDPILFSFTCTKSNKPISYSDQYGLFCEDRCGYDDAKAVQVELAKSMANIGKIMEMFN